MAVGYWGWQLPFLLLFYLCHITRQCLIEADAGGEGTGGGEPYELWSPLVS